MKLSRLLLAGLSAGLLLGTAGVAVAQNAPPPSSQGQYGLPPGDQGQYGPPPGEYGPPPGDQGPNQGPNMAPGRGHHFLPPELAMMWMRDHRDQMASMAPDQKRAFHHQLRAQFEAMSPQQKDALRNQLQSEWNALPPGAQQKFEQKLAERRSGGPGQYGPPQGPGQYGPPPGQGGPQGPYQGPPQGQDGPGPDGN
jgi:hypothetical protein